MLRESEFATWPRALTVCEANLHDFRIPGKFAFYVHILRAATWKADDEWIAKAFQFVESTAGESGSNAEFDLELTTLVRDYQQQSTKFLNSTPVRQRIHDAIRSFCCDLPLEGMQRVIECQNELALDSQGVMQAFPFGDNDDQIAPATLWRWISAMVMDELGIAPGTGADEKSQDRQTLNALHDMRQEVFPMLQAFSRLENLVVRGCCKPMLVF